MMRDELLQDSSNSDSSEEEDEDAKELTEDVEKTFFKTLSYIKKKDPQIYNENVNFFTKDESGGSQDQNKLKKKKKETPLNLRAYERKLIVERGGELSDEEQEFNDEEELRSQSPTYTEEQRELKESFKKVKLEDESDNDEETWGGLFRKRDKTTQEVKKEDKEYREWLKGQKNDLGDKEAKEDLKYLHDYWTDPKLDKGEQFLRDYILNKRFLEKDIEPEVDMNKLLEEEKELEEQTEFEQKYNYRFEEPDQEFIKRYPRVMANSLRLKDERRKEKRDEVKERKTKEKEKKKEEIKKKKKIKKQEIEAKLEELKKLTGNDQLAFESHLNADFDQDEYDLTMKRLFNEEFYSQEDPNFNPKDVMAEEYDGVWDEDCVINTEDANDVDLNCEDPNFVMDCDYDPTKKNKKEGKGRRARDKHRRTTVSEAVSREKPLFDPTQHCSFQEYVDQYYGIDCEDFIGDQPCRFKYKRVVANNYGLSVEEILAADDKELERWCSMKRIHKVGSDHKEKNDAKMYSKKAKDAELKKKILPSLYSENSEKDLENEETGGVKKKIKKKLNKILKDDLVMTRGGEENNETKENGENQINSTLDHENVTEHSKLSEDLIVNKKVKKRQRKHTDNDESNKMEENQIENKVVNGNDTELISNSDETKANKKVKKVKHDINNKNQVINTQNNTTTKVKFDTINNIEEKVRKRDDTVISKKKKKENNINLNINGLDLSSTEGKSRRQKKNQKAKLLKSKKKKTHKYSETLKIADKYEKIIMKKNTFKERKSDDKLQISDERLKAYGIKPKVFKDKLKYGTQFSMFLDG